MSDPSPPPSTDVPEQALAPAMPQVPEPPVASLNAIQAAHRIIAWHGVAKAIFTMIHGEIMQAAWIIRREHPEREDFDRFVAAHGLTDVMSPDRAWLAAETWEVARSQRSLLAVVTERPEEAMRFVWEFVSAGAERGLQRLEQDDPRIVGVLALPPRKRNSEIQRLVALGEAASEGRHPADVEQIRTLTEERDAAIEELERNRKPGPLDDEPAAYAFELHQELQELCTKLTATANEVEVHLDIWGSDWESAAMENNVRCIARSADMLIEQAERILGAASDETGEATD